MSVYIKERHMLKSAVGSLLLVTATHCAALSLGGTQGSVIIGRPFDILVQGSFDAAQAAAGLCLEAELLYGDLKIPASAVTVAVHRLGEGGQGLLRVRSSEPVNEPIVTLALKAGCQQTLRRSYSLLSDFEPLPVPAGRDVTAPRVQVQPAGVQPAVPLPATATAVARSDAAPPLGEDTPVRLPTPVSRPSGVAKLASKVRPADVVAPAKREVRSAVAAAPQAAQKAAGAARPRLKLDPLEVPVSGTPAVAAPQPKPEATATAAPPVAPEAAAPVPPSGDASVIAPSPAEALQAELKALRQEQQRLRLALETVNSQLSEARQGQTSEGWLYALAGAAVAGLGGLGWWLRGRRRSTSQGGGATTSSATQPWWQDSDVGGSSRLPADTERAVQAMPAEVKGVASSAGPTARPPEAEAPPEAVTTQLPKINEVDGLFVEEGGESIFQEVPVTQVPVGDVLDLWQQADFFESIGQVAEAMHALESFAIQFPRASEAVYLRWLALLQASGASAPEWAHAQSVYEHHFQRLAPKDLVGGALESDDGFMRALGAVWPMPEARALLERALFSQPGDPANPLLVRGVQVFDDVITLWEVLEGQATAHEPSFVSTVPAGGVSEAVEAPRAVVPAAIAVAQEPVPLAPPAIATPLPDIQLAEWVTVSDVKKTNEPMPAAPAASAVPAQVAEAPTESTAAAVLDPGMVLDFAAPAEPDVTSASEVAPPQAASQAEPAAQSGAAEALPSLDFDFLDFEPKPIKKSGPSGT